MADFNCRVVGIVVNAAKEILLLKRSLKYLPKSQEFIGWEFCGGGLEYNETPENAIIREYQEEAGIKIKVVKLLNVRVGKRDSKPLLNVVYICAYVAGDVFLTDEHDAYKWVGADELAKIDLGDHLNQDKKKFLELMSAD